VYERVLRRSSFDRTKLVPVEAHKQRFRCSNFGHIQRVLMRKLWSYKIAQLRLSLLSTDGPAWRFGPLGLAGTRSSHGHPGNDCTPSPGFTSPPKLCIAVCCLSKATVSLKLVSDSLYFRALICPQEVDLWQSCQRILQFLESQDWNRRKWRRKGRDSSNTHTPCTEVFSTQRSTRLRQRRLVTQSSNARSYALLSVSSPSTHSKSDSRRIISIQA
jgi:hypothetical protein